MERKKHELGLLDLMGRPAFCVAGGKLIQVNAAAAAFGLAPEMELAPLLLTGSEEYADFQEGCLYLTLTLDGGRLGASVTRLADYDVFCLEELTDSRELRAMALAARELRTPLSTVMITAQQLFPVSGLEDAPDTRRQVAQINRGLFQILRVIGNMSDAGQAAAVSNRMNTVNVSALFQEVFDKAASLAEHTEIRLEYQGTPRPVTCLADRESLERAALNMISNAMKFSAPGSIIRASLTRKGEKLYLSVEDTGTGIPNSIRGDVFNRYQRQCGLEDNRFGIGLGMVLIRAAAAAHGGAVLMDQPGEAGTRITMSMAIRKGNPTVHSPVLSMDYGGEMDHTLMELSQCLPASLYETEI